ncbi:MAG TPA: SRPBCC family protein, partial [Steroidobacteraceae bacterium]|nr:SRPBCC family protein [Steroidobacteraceae bacterium]
VEMRLVSGPFRALEGRWLLTPVEGGCRVELTMRFAFRNALTGLLFEPRFAETVGSLVDAFVARARDST